MNPSDDFSIIKKFVEEKLKIENGGTSVDDKEVESMASVMLGFVSDIAIDNELMTILNENYPNIRNTYKKFEATLIL